MSKWKIVFLSIVIVGYVIGVRDVFGFNKTIKRKLSYNTIEYYSLKAYFPWMTEERLGFIYKYSTLNKVSPVLIASVIDRESSGNRFAHGKVVYPYLYKEGIKVRVKSQAKGLMQVMDFHFRKGEDPFEEETNIKIGTKILARCVKGFSYIDDILKCYNSGPRSDYYHWRYINDIKKMESDVNNKVMNKYFKYN